MGLVSASEVTQSPASRPSEPILRPEFLPAGLRSPARARSLGQSRRLMAAVHRLGGLSPRARRCPGRFACRGFVLRRTTVPGRGSGRHEQSPEWTLAPAQPGCLPASRQRRQTRSGGTLVPSRFLRASVAAGAPGDRDTFVGVGKVFLSLWEPELGHPPLPPPSSSHSVPPAPAPALCGDSGETTPTPRG